MHEAGVKSQSRLLRPNIICLEYRNGIRRTSDTINPTGQKAQIKEEGCPFIPLTFVRELIKKELHFSTPAPRVP